jgi:basic membrane lipoprotein Med (substrate-binding protein (PBP1-ABC) superfamily)/ABC-type branched-subunit amino acid transport system substrate-binding protein
VVLAGDENVAIALPKGSDALRRLFNRALWLRWADGTLASVVTSIAADRPDWAPQLPRWLTVGVAQALSGDRAALGWAQLNGAEVAADRANAQGGVTIRGLAYDVLIAPADSACDGSRAVQAANQLLAGGAVAVLGHSCDSATFAAQPLYNAAGLAMVSASATVPGITAQGHNTTFRTVSKGDAAAILLAEQLYKLGGARRAVIIERSTFAGNYAADAFAETFDRLGGSIIHRGVVNTSAEYTATLSEILTAAPDVLYYADSIAADAGLLSRVAHGLGHGDVIVAWDPVWDGLSDANALRSAYVAAAGPAAQGDYVGWLHRPTSEMAGYAAFKGEYQAAGFERYGDEPGLFGALACDAMSVIVDAVLRADSLSPHAIRDEIAASPPWDGVAGRYQGFDAHGDAVPQRAWLESYHQGRWTRPVGVGLVVPFDDADDPVSWDVQQGVMRAESEWGILTQVYTATSEADWGPNLSQCASDGNTLCIAGSFLLESATRSAASAHRETYFAIVDAAADGGPSNLRGLTFSHDEPGYLAGVLAGSMTASDVVAVIGGEDVPTVRDFLQGFVNGARCANPGVTVRQSYAGTFEDPDRGAQLAQTMIQQGADVIFAPAGATGEGAVLAATQAGVWGIGVDVDYYPTVFDNGAVPGADRLLSSAVKRFDKAVYETIADVLSDAFTAGTQHYDLAGDGVGLAPFHEAEAAVPQSVRGEVDRVRRAIIKGVVSVDGPCVRPLGVGLIVPGLTVADGGPLWNAYLGLQRAESVLPVVGTVYTSTGAAQWVANVSQCAADGNALCFAASAELSQVAQAAATAHPATGFAIVGAAVDGGPDNLRGLVFAEDEASYLAGVLAGLKTRSNRVGAIADQMDDRSRHVVQGYRHGALCHNPNVIVDVRYAGTSSDPALGDQVASEMIAQGVDVLFAPAGLTGHGALLRAAQSGVWVIGADLDAYEVVFGSGTVAGADRLLSSTLKRVDNAVLETISDVVYDRFASGTVRYDLSNGGVGLAPFHEADVEIPQAVRDQLQMVEQGIVDGSIDVGEDCREALYLPLIVRNAT